MAVSRARAGAGAVAVAVPAVAVLVGYMARHPSGRLPGRVTLAKAPESTVFDENGAVRSVQSAKLSMPEADLGASYWHFLTRVTLGMVRVLYSDTDRRVTLFGRRFLTLLRFDAPEFEMEETRAKISWQIKDGLLVASNGRAEGGLALEVTRDEPDDEAAAQGTEGPRAELGIEVEVTNFYPAIASRLGDFIYRNTQAFIHVLVCNAFLRSLGHLELHESKIGRFPGGSRDAPGHSA
jgi:hypothetical protein